MTFEEYLVSPSFRLFKDEALRAVAIQAVEKILAKTSPVKRHQLYSIAAAIQGEGYQALADMARKQKEKNTNARNKAFWNEMDGILAKTSVSEISLFNFVKAKLLELGFIEGEDNSQDKKEQKQVRKRNNRLVEIAMDRILSVYFEHFNCHYFLKSQEGEKS